MLLQNIFYTLASIFMILGIIVLITISVLLFYAVRTITKVKEDITQEIKEVQDVIKHPQIIARETGNFIAESLTGGIRKMFKGN